MLGASRHFRQAFAALRCRPGFRQLHAVAVGDHTLVGGAEPALGRVLIVGVQHRVGVTVPVVATVPARRGQQAFTFATVGEAPADLPADIARIGKHQIQGNGTDFAAGVRSALDVLRAGQIEKGIQRFVVGEAWRLQREAETAALRRCLGTVEQRAVAGFVNGFANRSLAFDEVGFVAHTQRLPFAVDFISEAAALTADFFEEQILVIAEHAGHAPRHFAVEAAEHHWQTGNCDAGSLIFRRADLHETPQRRRGQWPVRIAGQQTLAAAAALRGDRPVVRSRRAEQVQRRQLLAGAAQLCQAGNLSVELESLQLVGLGHRQIFVWRRRAQPGEFVSGHGLREHQRLDFLRQVGRLTEVEQGKNQRRIFRFPVFRLVSAGGEVARQLVGVAEQVGIDAPCVHLEEAFEPGRRGLVQLAGAFLQIDRAHVAVGIEHRRAGHFR